MPNPLVSVVTPFYNTNEYLAQCIKSVMGQSYQDWEYILVNNCSSDGALETARYFASLDDRIRVYSNDRLLSQVQNYNHALTLISPQSKYTKIVQADDWIFPECLNEMVRVAEAYPSVGIVGSYRLHQTRVDCDRLPYPSALIPGKELCRRTLLGQCFVFGSATSLLFPSYIVRDRKLFYGESSNHEDTEACYEILQDHDFGFVHKVLTFTRTENDSISSTIRKYDPYHLTHHLMTVLRFGQTFLDEDEYQTLLKRTENIYLRFIVERLPWEGRRFWKFHKVTSVAFGYRFGWRKLLVPLFLEFVNLLLNPKMTVGKFTRYMTTNLMGSPAQ